MKLIATAAMTGWMACAMLSLRPALGTTSAAPIHRLRAAHEPPIEAFIVSAICRCDEMIGTVDAATCLIAALSPDAA